MRQFRYIVTSYIKRGILDTRVFLLLAGSFIFFWAILHNMPAMLRDMHLSVNPAVLIPSLLSSGIVYVMIFVIYILWINCFTYREDGQYELIRLGKKKWYARQCAYCFLTAVVLFAWTTICIFLILGSECNFSNTWGEVFDAVKSQGSWQYTGIIANIRVMSLPAWDSLTPYAAAGIYLILYILLATVLGILMTLLNLRFQKNIGSAAVFLIVMTNRVLSESASALSLFNKFWDYLYPMRIAAPMTRYSLLDQPIWQHILYAVIYFALCTGILWFAGKRALKKVDFSQQH